MFHKRELFSLYLYFLMQCSVQILVWMFNILLSNLHFHLSLHFPAIFFFCVCALFPLLQHNIVLSYLILNVFHNWDGWITVISWDSLHISFHLSCVSYSEISWRRDYVSVNYLYSLLLYLSWHTSDLRQYVFFVWTNASTLPIILEYKYCRVYSSLFASHFVVW